MSNGPFFHAPETNKSEWNVCSFVCSGPIHRLTSLPTAGGGTIESNDTANKHIKKRSILLTEWFGRGTMRCNDTETISFSFLRYVQLSFILNNLIRLDGWQLATHYIWENWPDGYRKWWVNRMSNIFLFFRSLQEKVVLPLHKQLYSVLSFRAVCMRARWWSCPASINFLFSFVQFDSISGDFPLWLRRDTQIATFNACHGTDFFSSVLLTTF